MQEHLKTSTAVDTTPNKQEQKRINKKREIASSAIEALKAKGYAHTSLRDIAAEMDLSLGILHYYFDDRVALINYCIEEYKRNFIETLSANFSADDDGEVILAKFSAGLAETILSEAELHSVWYDIRNQVHFNDNFRNVVTAIEGQLVDLVRMLLKSLNSQSPAESVYAAIDGLFYYFLSQKHCAKTISQTKMSGEFYSLIWKLAKPG